MNIAVNFKTLSIYVTQENTRYLSEYRELNEQGKVTLEASYFPTGDVYDKVIHTYIDDLVVQSNYYYGDDEVSHTVSFDYDHEKNVAKESTWYADGSVGIKNFIRDKAQMTEMVIMTNDAGDMEGREKVQFNEKGNIQEKILFDDNGVEIIETTSYKYDNESDVLIETNVKGLQGDLFRKYEHQKDDKGNMTELIVKNEKNKIIGKENVSFDDKNNMTQKEEVDYVHNRYSLIEWNYNEKNQNNAIRQFDEKGNLLVEILLEFNEHGHITLEETRNRQGVLLKEYIYD